MASKGLENTALINKMCVKNQKFFQTFNNLKFTYMKKAKESGKTTADKKQWQLSMIRKQD